MGDYINKSKSWTFRLYTQGEVCEMLRIPARKFCQLRKLGLFVGLIRRLDSRSKVGQALYTDRQIFEAIKYLFPGMPQLDEEYLEKQISEVPDSAAFKERRKKKRQKPTKKEILALVHARERERKRDEGERGGGIRSRPARAKWENRTSGYTERYCTDRLLDPGTDSDNSEDREHSDKRKARGRSKTKG